jgi:hypothetical protein
MRDVRDAQASVIRKRFVMKPTFPAAGLCLCFGLGAVSPAAAHHSSAMYDRAHPITVEATVKSFEWINPHSVLEVVADPTPTLAGGKLTVEMTSPGVLTRAGWTKRTFKPGDRIRLAYAPLRAGGPVGFFVQATTAAGQVMTYSFRPGERAGAE